MGWGLLGCGWGSHAPSGRGARHADALRGLDPLRVGAEHGAIDEARTWFGLGSGLGFGFGFGFGLGFGFGFGFGFGSGLGFGAGLRLELG